MSEQVETHFVTHDDGRFIRTALVVDDNSSIALVNKNGQFLGLLNAFTNDEGTWLALDVVDTEEQFDNRAVMLFENGRQHRLDTKIGTVMAVDMRKIAE